MPRKPAPKPAKPSKRPPPCPDPDCEEALILLADGSTGCPSCTKKPTSTDNADAPVQLA